MIICVSTTINVISDIYVDDIEVIANMLFKIYVANNSISATTTFLNRATATVISNNILVINDRCLFVITDDRFSCSVIRRIKEYTCIRPLYFINQPHKKPIQLEHDFSKGRHMHDQFEGPKVHRQGDKEKVIS